MEDGKSRTISNTRRRTDRRGVSQLSPVDDGPTKVLECLEFSCSFQQRPTVFFAEEIQFVICHASFARIRSGQVFLEFLRCFGVKLAVFFAFGCTVVFAVSVFPLSFAMHVADVAFVLAFAEFLDLVVPPLDLWVRDVR